MLNSPWLDSLSVEQKKRIYSPAEGNSQTDIVIIGAGIAGASTLYYTLEKTDKKIVLIEGERIAHGATGHNAGQVTDDLENDRGELVETYGKELVSTSLRGLQRSWYMLEEIIQKIGPHIPYWKFIGHGAYQNKEQFFQYLKEEVVKRDLGLHCGQFFVHPDFNFEGIPEEWRDLCTVVTRDVLAEKLQTKEEDAYIAALSKPMAVMNAAQFTTELINWCIEQHPDRVTIYEKSPVRMLELPENEGDKVRVLGDVFVIETGNVILCTNGFEHFSIHHNGVNINTRFHEDVRGVVGYMAGYEYPHSYEPSANWYMNDEREDFEHPLDKDPYDYITRRPFEVHGKTKGLLVVGGPESHLISHRNLYDKNKEIADRNLQALDGFIDKTVKESALLKRIYAWHGLMGYTKNGLRLVGKEPCAPGLWYNLGCNGIGILTSIYGADRIGRLLAGETLEKTIFDPVDQRCPS